MAGQSALLIGATGATGRHILTELLASPHFTSVGEYGRRVTPRERLTAAAVAPSGNGAGVQLDKLVQRTIDFERIEESGLGERRWDVVFIALGTTRAIAGSAANFEKIDREYVINAARAAKSTDKNYAQRLVYISSTSASPSSSFLYPRSKGLTEVGLAGLGYSDTIVFRPALLAGAERPDSRLAESIAETFTGMISHVWSGIEIKVQALAKAVVTAGRVGSEGLPESAGAESVGSESGRYTIIRNKGAIALSKE